MNAIHKRKFIMQRQNARRRKIAWHLTFEQWWNIWKRSGKWKRRGRKRGQYCMSRNKDRGAYEIGNVTIKTVSQNARELPRARPEEFKQAVSKQMLGNKLWIGRHHTAETKAKMSRSKKAYWRRRK